MSTRPLLHALREVAAAFGPGFEIAREEPERLALVLRETSGRELRLRYRSERGLFLRTYFLVVETVIRGGGPQAPATLALRRRKLAWRRPKPPDGEAWAQRLNSTDLGDSVKRVQIERLSLTWDPARATWRFALETLDGSVTSTFFPPLLTPNPLRRDEAAAVVTLVDLVERAVAD